MPFFNILKYKPVTFLLSVFILMAVAFYNGYPLVTPDTGSYINHAFDFQVPADRSPFYGVFLGISSLWISLWLTVLVQAVVLTWLLFRFFNLVIGKPVSGPTKFLLTGAIVAFTAAGWVTDFIMPDIFAAILLLAVILYLYTPTVSKFYIVVYFFIIYGAALIHNSHIPILFLFSFLLLVSVAAKKYAHYLRKAITLLAISVLGWLSLCTLNYAKGFGFTLSSGSHVFMMGKLAETGILNSYLNEHCAEDNYQLCAYKDDIPSVAWEFLWLPQSPLYKTGGWDSSKAEHDKIIKGVFTSPKYTAWFAAKSVTSTCRQLAQVQMEAAPQGYQSSPWISVSKFFPHELKEYFYSAQNVNVLHTGFSNHIFLLFFIISSIWIIIRWQEVGSKKLGDIYALVLLFILCNAFVTATFANVLYRLQVRVFWLLPATNAVVMLYYYIARYRDAGKDIE